MNTYTNVFFNCSLLLTFFLGTSLAEQCGRQAGNAACANGLCCSNYGWCGSTNDYCGAANCQSQCPSSSTPSPSSPTPTPSGSGDVGSIITPSIFDQMLKYRNDARCQSNGFYTYDAFITAARSFNGFGTTGDLDTRRRELAAFFGQTSCYYSNFELGLNSRDNWTAQKVGFLLTLNRRNWRDRDRIELIPVGF